MKNTRPVYSESLITGPFTRRLIMSPISGEIHINTDVLVIGGGMAGLVAAIKAKHQGQDVTLADKAYVGKSGGTHYAGGTVLFFRPERGHRMKDWISLINEKCEYLNNREWDEICLNESRDRYDDLVSWGVKFAQEDGKLRVRTDIGAGRSLSPSVKSIGSAYETVLLVFKTYAPTLRKKALESGVRLLDRIMFCELLKQDGKIVGAAGFHTVSGELYIIQAKATIIATGSTALKTHEQPSHYWTGDGETMAYRAGAEVANKEFFGTLVGPDRVDYSHRLEQAGKASKVSGKIIDALNRFPIWRDGPPALADPNLNAEGGPVSIPPWEAHCGRAPLYLDLDVFPKSIIEWSRSWLRINSPMWTDKIGLDIYNGGKIIYPGKRVRTDAIPAGTGIWPINKYCATALPGLYAAGNSCGTMASGGSYIGIGFGLNHAAVTGNRAALAATEYASKSKPVTIDEAELARVKQIICAPLERRGGFSPGWVTQVLHGFTVPYFMLQVKHGERLQAALTMVEFLNQHIAPKLMAKDAHEWRLAHETKNMILVAEMMLRSSLYRTESRGIHFREDYPRRDDPKWLAWVKLKDEQGEMKLYKEPIPKEWWPDLTRPYEERYPRMLPGE
jgi:succinate dehydrogenase/fumarate reductase flavoprotein subunit